MNTLTHPSEEVMALLDGELTAVEAKAVSDHIDQCAECAALRDELRRTSESLSAWHAPAISTEVDQAVEERIERAAAKRKLAKPRAYTPLTIRNWRLWAIGGGAALAAVLGFLFITLSATFYENHRIARFSSSMVMEQKIDRSQKSGDEISTYAYSAPRSGVAGMEGYAAHDSLTAPARLPAKSSVMNGLLAPPPPIPAPPTAPLIARSVSLTVIVKDFDVAHAKLEAILEHRSAYAADLTILEGAPPHGLEGSLRVPVGELRATLDELRNLGHVEQEKQSGEEVTQQHTDLVARLTNARETEARLRDILAHRTGKMEDVLEVEEKISETRGEIEQLEAEQKALEHRVDFASIDLKLVEEYKAQLDNSPTSVGTQMRNSLVAGLHHAGASLLGLVLFFEEYGPVLLIWLAILGGPALLLWHRYRRARID